MVAARATSAELASGRAKAVAIDSRMIEMAAILLFTGIGTSPPTCKRAAGDIANVGLLAPAPFVRRARHRQPIEGAAAGHLDVTPDGEEPAKRMGRSRGGPDRPAARPSTPGMREVRWAEVVGSEPAV